VDMINVGVAAEIPCSTIAQALTIAVIGVTVVLVVILRTSNSRISNGHHTNRVMAVIIQVFAPHHMAVKHTTRLPVGVHLVEEALRTNTTLTALGVAVMGLPMEVLVEIIVDMAVMAVAEGIRGEAVTAVMVVMAGRLPMAIVAMAPVMGHITTPVAGAEADIDHFCW
jgi:hypothetical protein